MEYNKIVIKAAGVVYILLVITQRGLRSIEEMDGIKVPFHFNVVLV